VTAPQNAVLGELRTALQYVAPFEQYKKGLFKRGVPPRYVWVPLGGPFEGARGGAQNPHPIALWPFSVDVHCWGVDDDGAYDLVRALATVVERAVRGRNFVIKGVLAANPDTLEKGALYIVRLVLKLQVIEATLPTSAGGPITDAALTNVTGVNPVQATPSLSTPGDGVLEGTET
jgi:hypothetical protein